MELIQSQILERMKAGVEFHNSPTSRFSSKKRCLALLSNQSSNFKHSNKAFGVLFSSLFGGFGQKDSPLGSHANLQQTGMDGHI